MSESSDRISLETPAKAICSVPYLLGYVPDRHLVILALSDAGRLIVTGSIELAKARFRWPQLPQLIANGVTKMILIGYGPAESVTPAIDHLQALLTDCNIEVVEALRVSDGRYWLYDCDDVSCCPPEGRPIGDETSVDAAFVATGAVAAPNRESIRAYLDPAPDAPAVAAVLAELKEPLGEHKGVFRRAMEAADAGDLPTVHQTATLGRRLAGENGVDAAVAAIDDTAPEVDRVRLWVWLTRQLSGEYRAHAAAVCAYAAWRSGRGILAIDAVELALSIQPGNHLAQIMHHALAQALSPDSALDTSPAP